MNTSDTTVRPCVKESQGLNRFRACDTPPALRTGLRPDSISELLCSENGGGMKIQQLQRHLTTSDDAVTPTDQSLASEGVGSEDISMGRSLPCSPSGSDEPGYQESHQSSVSEGDKLQYGMPEDTPVALRTRSKRQRQDEHTLDNDVNRILDRS